MIGVLLAKGAQERMKTVYRRSRNESMGTLKFFLLIGSRISCHCTRLAKNRSLKIECNDRTTTIALNKIGMTMFKWNGRLKKLP